DHQIVPHPGRLTHRLIRLGQQPLDRLRRHQAMKPPRQAQRNMLQAGLGHHRPHDLLPITSPAARSAAASPAATAASSVRPAPTGYSTEINASPITPPASCAITKPGTLTGAMPAKLSEKARPSVTAGLAKL